jgi:L-rhamnose mutarotase
MRICFQMQVKPDRLAEYTERHAAVWPDMLQAIADAGRRNYSLFLREDGMLIGYYETDDDEAAQRALEADPRTAAWEAEMSDFFVASAGRPDQADSNRPEPPRPQRFPAHRPRHRLPASSHDTQPHSPDFGPNSPPPKTNPSHPLRKR